MVDESQARSITPFSIVSSSVSGGAIDTIRNRSGLGNQNNFDITNVNREYYGGFTSDPIQSPFTDTWVGGFSHRHNQLNSGSEVPNKRQEAFHIDFINQEVRIYNHTFMNSKPAFWSRDGLAKRPINIANIHTTASTTSSNVSNIIGNFQNNYEIIQMPGRYANNLLRHRLSASVSSSGQVNSVFSESFGQSISYFLSFSGSSISPSLNSQISGSYLTNSLGIQNLRNNNRFTDTQITDRKTKSILVCRFNAPGSFFESSRVSMDPESEELANNSCLLTRNIKIRQLLDRRLQKSGN